MVNTNFSSGTTESLIDVYEARVDALVKKLNDTLCALKESQDKLKKASATMETYADLVANHYVPEHLIFKNQNKDE